MTNEYFVCIYSIDFLFVGVLTTDKSKIELGA